LRHGNVEQSSQEVLGCIRREQCGAVITRNAVFFCGTLEKSPSGTVFFLCRSDGCLVLPFSLLSYVETLQHWVVDANIVPISHFCEGIDGIRHHAGIPVQIRQSASIHVLELHIARKLQTKMTAAAAAAAAAWDCQWCQGRKRRQRGIPKPHIDVTIIQSQPCSGRQMAGHARRSCRPRIWRRDQTLLLFLLLLLPSFFPLAITNVQKIAAAINNVDRTNATALSFLCIVPLDPTTLLAHLPPQRFPNDPLTQA